MKGTWIGLCGVLLLSSGMVCGDPVGPQAEQIADQVEIALEGDQGIGLEVVLDGFHGEGPSSNKGLR